VVVAPFAPSQRVSGGRTPFSSWAQALYAVAGVFKGFLSLCMKDRGRGGWGQIETRVRQRLIKGHQECVGVCIRAVLYHIVHDNTGINLYMEKKCNNMILTI